MAETTGVRPGGLVTVAFLKAQLDAGSDHLGIFMPLVLDVIARWPTQSFTTGDIQEALALSHGLAMPQQTVATLLKRATAQKHLSRESGRYVRRVVRGVPSPEVANEKSRIEESQKRLGEALRSHAGRRGVLVESTETALDMLFRFLEAEQVTILLGRAPGVLEKADASHRERMVVAEFIQDVVSGDPALVAVLGGMLEGLVLYHAAFLPDIGSAGKHFKNLRVVFDSNLVRQTLGYEGKALRTLMGETLDVLKASGVQCLVFDKTVHEIHRILAMYEKRLATAAGRSSLRPVPMARHFLTARYSPSDVREMSALLEMEIAAAGFQTCRAPDRVRDFTAGEQALAARLADPTTKDELEPRVVHDVDCVAGILTLRRGKRSTSIEDAGAVFATGSPMVVRNTRLWWDQDEHESGVEPVVHVRALSNLAWLKKPSLCSDFKVRELVALCTAALRPDRTTWEKFLRHLDSLEKSRKLSSDEVVAVLVSAMSDQLLRDAELEGEDPNDIDAVTLDEIVSRVTATYEEDAEGRIQVVRDEYEARLADLEARKRAATDRAEAAEGAATKSERRRELLNDGRARRWARLVTRCLRWAIVVIVLAGALALVVQHPFYGGWLGISIGIAVVVFVALEALGILRHLLDWSNLTEIRLTRCFRDWLDGETQPSSRARGFEQT